jgi:hypothetical protein
MKLETLILPFVAVFAFGCSSGSSEPTGGDGQGGGVSTERRIPIGKADSLAGKCNVDGKKLCGGKSKKKCYCDAACSQFGDCCSDYEATCGDTGTSCESTADCPQGEFCSSPNGCDSPGTCKPLPTDVFCTAVVLPYCGCDGQTKQSTSGCIYDRYAHGGACEQKSCGGFANLPCDPGQICVDAEDSCDPNNGGADCPGVCVAKTMCGGFAGLPCPNGDQCVDDPDDDCDPQNGGADCSGVCIPGGSGCPGVACNLFCPNGFQKGPNGCDICACAEAPAGSCDGHCGGQSADKSCYCDAACEKYGDCCGDYAKLCDVRTPASGVCVKNSNDACSSDADCKGGGCGGELCYNPQISGGISTGQCTAPTNVAGCGCVSGKCTWYN